MIYFSRNTAKCQGPHIDDSIKLSPFIGYSIEGAAGRLQPVGGSLPCLFSNNSNSVDIVEKKCELFSEVLLATAAILSPYHKRQAETLHRNVERFISEKGICNVGFLTLTFPDNVKEPSEACKRFNSFNTGFLSQTDLFGDWLSVKERQIRGAWHYHLLIDCCCDIRTGIDFDELARGKYSSAPGRLHFLWRVLRSELSKYGFGRSELLPVKSNVEAMSYYLGKYISKHLASRSARDKGVRLVNYSRSWLKNSIRFQWNTDGSKEWRRKVRLFAQMNGCSDLYDLTKKLGPSWAYNHAQTIFDIDDLLTRASAGVPF